MTDEVDEEVERGQNVYVTPQQKLMERCHRYLRLEDKGAPEIIMQNERRLIQQALQECTQEDVAYAMRDFASNVARHERIEREVEAENPPYPDDD